MSSDPTNVDHAPAIPDTAGGRMTDVLAACAQTIDEMLLTLLGERTGFLLAIAGPGGGEGHYVSNLKTRAAREALVQAAITTTPNAQIIKGKVN